MEKRREQMKYKKENIPKDSLKGALLGWYFLSIPFLSFLDWN